MMQENGMMLEVLPLEAGGARLVRVYGQDPCVVLPGSVPAPAGGSWPITELGDYCFSEKPRSLPASDAVCRYQVDDTGAVRLTRAFGQAVGGSARRYDFDFDAPAADPDDLHPVCGSFVEEVTLPDRLQVIGSCAFYNCRKLRLLTVGAEGLTLGSDVFLNCFALETIRVQAEADEATGLFALVNNITEAVRAEFRPAGAAAPLAALWYPAYWEDIEETPAHILLHTFSGQGYHYRQCFLNNKFLPAEYDAIFPQGHDADDANIMAMLCFDRLRWPWQLSETAALPGLSFRQHRSGARPSFKGAGHRQHPRSAGTGRAGQSCLCRGGCPCRKGGKCRCRCPASRRGAQKIRRGKTEAAV